MNHSKTQEHFQALMWQENTLILLDQRKLPAKETHVACRTLDEVINAIANMTVRGAPAIGIAAAYACVLAANEFFAKDNVDYSRYEHDLERLKAARPTAVNLMWAVESMRTAFELEKLHGYQAERFLSVAKSIHQSDIDNNIHMGDLACEVFSAHGSSPVNMMTHCNAGALATGGFGTALGAIKTAWQAGLVSMVYADETRPWLQGSRLTAWELTKAGVPVTLNAEGAASWIMKERQVKWVVVGADRIAANGDIANKVGTYALAIQAKYHGAKVMVVAPTSTVDFDTKCGSDIEIEMRSMDELKFVEGIAIASEDAKAINPVFDITPAELVDCIVTEKGVVYKPSVNSMKQIRGAC